jgi:hypothetical protein
VKQLLIIVSAVFLLSTSFHLQGQGAPAGSLAWWAAQAKAKGQNQITVTVRGDSNGSGSSLQENLKAFTVVQAIPIEKKTEPSSDSVDTWYRFKLVEVLSKPPACSYCDSISSPPRDFQPRSANEFVLPISGGSVVQDGITITFRSAGIPDFKLNQPYLLFVILPGNGAARLASGSAGVYQIDPKGVLQPGSPGSALLKQHVVAFGDLEHLRNAIKAP